MLEWTLFGYTTKFAILLWMYPFLWYLFYDNHSMCMHLLIPLSGFLLWMLYLFAMFVKLVYSYGVVEQKENFNWLYGYDAMRVSDCFSYNWGFLWSKPFVILKLNRLLTLGFFIKLVLCYYKIRISSNIFCCYIF